MPVIYQSTRPAAAPVGEKISKKIGANRGTTTPRPGGRMDGYGETEEMNARFGRAVFPTFRTSPLQYL
jgi:hypothetical protein